jgi:tRNA(Arg) A34 adenosine deaminase TadA
MSNASSSLPLPPPVPSKRKRSASPHESSESAVCAQTTSSSSPPPTAAAAAAATGAASSHALRRVLYAVLSDVEERSLMLERYFVCHITVPERINQLMAFIRPIFPLPKHLKRIRRCADGTQSLLLCTPAALHAYAVEHDVACLPTNDDDDDDDDDDDNDNAATTAADQQRVPAECGVPSRYSTPACLALFGVRGPLHCVYAPKFAPQTRDQFFAWKDVWPLASSVFSASTAPVHSLADGELRVMWTHMSEAVAVARQALLLGGVGAVLVNPDTNTVVARACDMSRAVDPVTGAVRASRGAPLQHAVMALLATWGRACCAVRDAGAAPHYLCRGFDLYVTLEPCVMCAMALLHSRVRRVVFGARNAVFGGLGSRVRVHQQPALNHRYAVYGGCMRHECEQLLPVPGHGTCVGHSLNAAVQSLADDKSS